MEYLTIEVLEDGCFKYKDWVYDGIIHSKYYHLIRYILEEEIEDYISKNEKT